MRLRFRRGRRSRLLRLNGPALLIIGFDPPDRRVERVVNGRLLGLLLVLLLRRGRRVGEGAADEILVWDGERELGDASETKASDSDLSSVAASSLELLLSGVDLLLGEVVWDLT